jgi:SsrA-binding protein
MRIFNKKAKFNYRLLERFEAGISLLGPEVKAVKRGRVDLTASYVKIISGEVYLINANIAVEEKQTRTRKLLLKKNQIVTISAKVKAKRLTIVPTKVYTRGRLVKVEIALAKRRRNYEKRELIKRKDIEREIEQELKDRRN